MPGRKPAPQFWAWPLGRPRPSVSYIVTNAGRFWLSLPRPYVTQAPTQGKPIRLMPALIWNSAGEWVQVAVVVVRGEQALALKQAGQRQHAEAAAGAAEEVAAARVVRRGRGEQVRDGHACLTDVCAASERPERAW